MLLKKLQELYDIYHEIKREIKSRDKNFYERWKAGGFIVDEDILSMYPVLSDFMDEIEDEEDEDLDIDE